MARRIIRSLTNDTESFKGLFVSYVKILLGVLMIHGIHTLTSQLKSFDEFYSKKITLHSQVSCNGCALSIKRFVV